MICALTTVVIPLVYDMHSRGQRSDSINLCLYNTTHFLIRFTYEVSPVFILIEEIVLKKMQSFVGWSDDEGDGIFCPGNICKEILAEMWLMGELLTLNICRYLICSLYFSLKNTDKVGRLLQAFH